ncbi:UNVERIFIED_CONTAM: hypothetical protein FKN15_074333 [Acipenser sinensis]
MWPSKPFQPRRPQERQWRRAPPQQQAQSRGSMTAPSGVSARGQPAFVRPQRGGWRPRGGGKPRPRGSGQAPLVPNLWYMDWFWTDAVLVRNLAGTKPVRYRCGNLSPSSGQEPRYWYGYSNLFAVGIGLILDLGHIRVQWKTTMAFHISAEYYQGASQGKSKDPIKKDVGEAKASRDSDDVNGNSDSDGAGGDAGSTGVKGVPLVIRPPGYWQRCAGRTETEEKGCHGLGGSRSGSGHLNLRQDLMVEPHYCNQLC